MTDEQRKRIHVITYSTDDRMELAERIVELEDENAQLRKVCMDAYRAICKMYVYIDGEWNYGDAHADPTYEPILSRMRELGIEVDE